MADTCIKGSLAETIIMADAARRGYKVAIPVGHDWKYDLIVERNGKLERVQCKYTESDGEVIIAKCKSTSYWVHYKYTSKDIDWVAIYDATTDKCYYIPAESLGEDGKSYINLRLKPTKNNQTKGVTWAKDYIEW